MKQTIKTAPLCVLLGALLPSMPDPAQAAPPTLAPALTLSLNDTSQSSPVTWSATQLHWLTPAGRVEPCGSTLTKLKPALPATPLTVRDRRPA